MHIPRSVNTHMLRLLGWIVRPLFLVTMLPMCCLIAVMDHNNRFTFRHNLREIMGESVTSDPKNLHSKK